MARQILAAGGSRADFPEPLDADYECEHSPNLSWMRFSRFFPGIPPLPKVSPVGALLLEQLVNVFSTIEP